MRQKVSKQMDGGLIAQQSFAEGIELIRAVHESLFFYEKGMPAAIVLHMEENKHD